MKEITEQWTAKVLSTLDEIASTLGIDASGFADLLHVGKPPKSDMGDLSYPLFPFAKELKTSPVQLAAQVAEKLDCSNDNIKAHGPYVNIRIDRNFAINFLLTKVEKSGETWGEGKELSNQKVMIEFSSPNTNKPLHLGHLRNNIIGESCARILNARGAQVRKVNLVNDRGVHICKSMLAYKKFGNGETPESLGVKSDCFVGDFYVKYAQWAQNNASAEEEAQRMLHLWEAGDTEVLKLWKKMNKWALEGINATYKRTGISFDKLYRESETYLLGREQVEKGLANGVFFKHEDGSIRLDMQEIGLDTKVFLRSNRTSVYITQDLGTAINRHEEWPFERLIYVVANEQDYHFKVLFFALKKLGFPWASRLQHLSYGMVSLPDGKMKSREGTVVDADKLIDTLSEMALNEIKERDREHKLGKATETAEKIALAALHYFLLQVSPEKDMMFNPKESLSFTGNTGPYLQYMVARLRSLITKTPKEVLNKTGDTALLTRDDEWELIRRIGTYPQLVAKAAEKLDPSILALGLYELARDFSRYYHEVPIAMAENTELAASRMRLVKALLSTLKSGFRLLNIPYIESM